VFSTPVYKELNIDIAGEFMVMGANLIYLKAGASFHTS
jgi:chromatin segregation and condensation protein Rec8/ScpA/Scc1 (kleisin family)